MDMQVTGNGTQVSGLKAKVKAQIVTGNVSALLQRGIWPVSF